MCILVDVYVFANVGRGKNLPNNPSFLLTSDRASEYSQPGTEEVEKPSEPSGFQSGRLSSGRGLGHAQAGLDVANSKAKKRATTD